jgi:hypothetical protein
MANKNLLVYGSRVAQVKQAYYSPTLVNKSATTKPVSVTYCFLSKVDPWEDEGNPTTPTQDQKSIKKVFKNIFAVKLLTAADISPVIERDDWNSNVIYDYYRDDVDMFEQDANGLKIYNYYTKNKYDQVFKCLWNNNGGISTQEPFFEPGSYGTNNIYTGTDGYKWKYIYTIDPGSKLKFMDSTWMPVAVGINTPNPLSTTAGAGSLDVINVTNGGSGYNTVNAVVTVVITGDGTGAVATANVSSGSVADIIVTSAGTNYTYANVAITSAQGSGAVAFAPSSPIGGHGFDPMSELGCTHVMYTAQFSGSENNLIPTDIDFHQIGLLNNPYASDTITSGLFANGSVYSTTTDLIVAPGFGAYTADEYVYQGTSVNNNTFIGTVLSFDTSTNVVKILNTTGTLSTNAPLFGNTSGTTRTLLSYSTPKFVLSSGNIFTIENRTGVQRSTDGIEQFRFVLGY